MMPTDPAATPPSPLPEPSGAPFTHAEVEHLRALAYRFPSIDAALAEAAHLRAVLTLPKGTVHVVSDVHGEFKKLEHILRNASGSLRPVVEQLFGGRLSEEDRVLLLSLVYYPRETWHDRAPRLADAAARAAFARTQLDRMVEVLRVLASRSTLRGLDRALPEAFRPLFRELIFAPTLGREGSAYTAALVAPFVRDADGAGELLRVAARAVRALSVYEVVVAGDLGDRGPRIDLVISALRHQPRLAIVWGNHDAEWLGACLGQPALAATVLRNSLRYGRIAQLEEGYGVPIEPVEKLAREAYGDDPAERFRPRVAGDDDVRDATLLAQMQKAAAVLQFKLEGQTSRRNPHFGLADRCLLHRIDPEARSITLPDGAVHPLLDARLPTVDLRPGGDPYALTPAEQTCLAHVTRAFVASPRLWDDMRFVADRGAMYLSRDDHLVFHGCVPVDAAGAFLPFEVDGVPRAGRALFDALDLAARRALRTRDLRDTDLFYYLWAGPRSPLFGKDKMATFEGYFLADKATHHETKNPYFKLIHDAAFCRRVAVEFGVDPERVLIVNGHVPVKLDQGESPLKASGLAVTIDGAFSEAYGDQGYTLVLDAARTYLALHHHFESVQDAITRGTDIVPTVQEIRRYDPPRTVGDTPRGAQIAREIAWLERLIEAFRAQALRESVG
jgi:fructose-1,6-bisphosphatase-3